MAQLDPNSVSTVLEGISMLLGLLWAPVLVIIPAIKKIGEGVTQISNSTQGNKNKNKGAPYDV